METDYMFWYVFTGTHYHIQCQRAPEDADGATDKVIQVQIIRDDQEDHDGMREIVEKVVRELNNAVRYWSLNHE